MAGLLSSPGTTNAGLGDFVQTALSHLTLRGTGWRAADSTWLYNALIRPISARYPA
jgi:hypothetical protein